MKKLLFSICLAIASSGVLAEESETVDACTFASKFAESVMGARQRGANIREVMDILPNGPTSKFMKGVVIEAYKKTRYHSESNQKRAITDFSNSIYLVCLEV